MRLHRSHNYFSDILILIFLLLTPPTIIINNNFFFALKIILFISFLDKSLYQEYVDYYTRI